MNGRKAKMLRNAARKLTVGRPERKLVVVAARGDKVVFGHTEGTTRRAYQELKTVYLARPGR